MANESQPDGIFVQSFGTIAGSFAFSQSRMKQLISQRSAIGLRVCGKRVR